MKKIFWSTIYKKTLFYFLVTFSGREKNIEAEGHPDDSIDETVVEVHIPESESVNGIWKLKRYVKLRFRRRWRPKWKAKGEPFLAYELKLARHYACLLDT